MKNLKNVKLMLLTALVAMGSVNAFAQELATTVWRYTASGNDATLVGFVAEYPNASKADVVIPQTVTDPVNASKKYTVKVLNDDLFTAAEKSLIKSITFSNTAITAINDKVFAGLTNLETLDLTGATGLTTIADAAFKGTKITSLDLSRTKVTAIGNLFGTNYQYIATGGTYTQAEANAANVAYLQSKGQTFVKEGDPVLETATFAGYDQINTYYKSIYPGAKANGDVIPMDKAEANSANATAYTNCVEAGDDVIFTLETALAWNVANVSGAMNAGYVLDEITAGVFNAATGASKAAGYTLTANEAQAYNESLASGTVTYKNGIVPATGSNLATDVVAIVGNAAFDETGADLVYDDDTAYAYNLANQPGCFVVGDPGSSTFTSHLQAYNWNNANVVPAAAQKGLGDTGSVASGTFYDAAGAYTANLAKVPTANQTKTGDSKAGTTVPAVNNNTLKSLTLNAIWTSIAAGAFENCTALATVNFGTATAASQTVGDRAFLGAPLTEVNLIGTKIATLNSDTFVDYDKSHTDKANSNNTIASVKFNKIFTNVAAGLFANCTALSTVEFEDRDIATASAPGSPVSFKVAFNGIGEYAFANTAIESIVVPQALDASKSANFKAVADNAFYNCQKLKSFTYMIDNETIGIVRVVGDLAFPGCTDVAYITTNANVAAYAAAGLKAPKNTHFQISSADGYVTPFETKEFAKQPGKYYIKYLAVADIKVKKDEAKVYDAYLDDTDYTLNMTLYKSSGSYYNIKAGDCVLIITKKKDLTFETASGITSGSFNGASNALQIVTAKDGISRATLDYLAGADKVVYGWVNSAAVGTGFQKITSGDVFGQGTMYVLAGEPAEDARLNVVWRDETGAIESDPTAIESIQNVAESENGEIFNLQGVRVSGAQKGIFIKNGKKYIVK